MKRKLSGIVRNYQIYLTTDDAMMGRTPLIFLIVYFPKIKILSTIVNEAKGKEVFSGYRMSLVGYLLCSFYRESQPYLHISLGHTERHENHMEWYFHTLSESCGLYLMQ